MIRSIFRNALIRFASIGFADLRNLLVRNVPIRSGSLRRRFAGRAIAALMLCAAPAAPGAAQDTRQNEPGNFDFYVLSLSWSPSFCDAAGERAQQQPECQDRPYAFVVQGLWPQYERGFPEYCRVPAPRLDRGIVSSMLDLMPAPSLIFRGWDRHGTCSGLSARAYFETIRKARAVVKIPPEYIDVKSTLTLAPNEVEDAFVRANPGMTRGAIAVSCDEQRLREVRVCLSKDLKYHECPEVDGRSCRREQIVVPPMRGRQTAADASTRTK